MLLNKCRQTSHGRHGRDPRDAGKKKEELPKSATHPVRSLRSSNKLYRDNKVLHTLLSVSTAAMTRLCGIRSRKNHLSFSLLGVHCHPPLPLDFGRAVK